MSCCCFFGCGVFVSVKYLISVKENDYQALFGNGGKTISERDHPGIQLSPSYSAGSSSGEAGFPTLMTLAKFSLQRSDDEAGCFLVKDTNSKQVCVIRTSPPACCSFGGGNLIFFDNEGNELVHEAEECNVGQGRRQIGHMQYRYCCVCDSKKTYSETSDFHLQVVKGQDSLRYKSSQDNREIAQVFTSLKGTNGLFPADLDLAMKIAVISDAVGLHARLYVN